jgi:glycosyltransferase involved in cell wall biosynthesis
VAWVGGEWPQGRLAFGLRLGLSWPTITGALTRDGVRNFTAALGCHLRTSPADLVHFTHPVICPILDASPVPVAGLMFDLGFRQLRRESELAATRRGRVCWTLEAGKTALWERYWLSRAEGLACVSSVDSEALARLTGRDVQVIPNPISETFFERPKVHRSATTVTFVASLSWRPNVDGAIWLAREVWPRVVAAVPEARLQVVGFRPEPEVIDAVRAAGGEIHADVDDVRPFLWSAAVAVSPLRLGSGLRNKVLHAMACGAPLVATTASIEGVRASHGDHLLVADRAEPFAAAVATALGDRKEALARAERARLLAEDFRITAVMTRLERWWRDTAATPVRRGLSRRMSVAR